MSWYHAASGQQAGPFTPEQFRDLIASGTVQPSTLVWEARLPNWVPLAQVPPDLLPPAALPGAPDAPAGAPATGGMVCSECGQVFPPDQVIRIADRQVCAGCKPIYMQKLREGTAPLDGPAPGAARYAGFWIRFVAKFIDGLIVGIPLMLLFFVGGAVFGSSMAAPRPGGGQTMDAAFAMIGMQLGLQALSIVINGAYNVFFVYKYGATPGKMAVGLRIYMSDGSRLSLGRCFGRFFAEILSGLVCYIGYIIAGFDAEKRSLHDHICNTRVVYK